MGAVAQGFVVRLAAAAQGDGLAPREVKRVPLRILDYKTPRDAVWAVGCTDNGGFAHSWSPWGDVKKTLYPIDNLLSGAKLPQAF
jgi:hypothetical protein